MEEIIEIPVEEEKTVKKTKWWKVLLKVGFTGLAFYLIYRKIDFDELGATLASANYFLLGLSVLIYFCSQIISSLRLNVVLRESRIFLSERDNLKLYFVGIFYNLFLPGGVGGDGYKVHLFKKYQKIPIKTSLRTVLYDRLSGLSALCFLICITGTFQLQDYKWAAIVGLPLTWIGFYIFTRIFFKSFKRIVTRVGLYSLVIQSIQLLCAFVILYAIGVRENYLAFLLVLMVATIVSILPIFLGGAGARELTFIFIFEQMGMDAQTETAIALSLLFFVVSALNAVPGIFINERKLLS